MTPLRQRFIDDLRLKNFSDGTIKVYVHAVEKFARFLGRSPDESTAEDVREFLIHELDRGLSRSYIVIQQNALRHLYLDTLGRTDELQAIPRPKRERRLPVVLSREEVRRLFAVTGNLKHKALLMVAYDAGLRLSEILNLRCEDIALDVAGGMVVVEVQAGLAHGNRCAQQVGQAFHPVAGLMRVDPGGRPDVLEGLRRGERRPAVLKVAPDRDHADHAGLPGSGHHLGSVRSQVAVVVEPDLAHPSTCQTSLTRRPDRRAAHPGPPWRTAVSASRWVSPATTPDAPMNPPDPARRPGSRC